MLNRRELIFSLTSVCFIPNVLERLKQLIMAKADTEYLQGKVMWTKVHSPDTFGNWKVTLYPNQASIDKINEFKKKGLKNILKKDDDGYNMTFRRPTQKMIKGKVVGFAPPTVMNKDGQPLTEYIGNGSDATLKLSCYGYKSPQGEKGYAARLDSIRVDNLIPFVGKRDFSEEDVKQVGQIIEQPAQVEGW